MGMTKGGEGEHPADSEVREELSSSGLQSHLADPQVAGGGGWRKKELSVTNVLLFQ